MHKAKEIMTENPFTVTVNTPIHEAMRILIENNTSGLPVVNDNMEISGIVTQKDMLQVLQRSQLGGASVSEIMTRDITTFDTEDSVFDVCNGLIESSYMRIPIVSEGKLVGIISRRDILQFIVDLANWGETLDPDAPGV